MALTREEYYRQLNSILGGDAGKVVQGVADTVRRAFVPNTPQRPQPSPAVSWGPREDEPTGETPSPTWGNPPSPGRGHRPAFPMEEAAPEWTGSPSGEVGAGVTWQAAAEREVKPNPFRNWWEANQAQFQKAAAARTPWGRPDLMAENEQPESTQTDGLTDWQRDRIHWEGRDATPVESGPPPTQTVPTTPAPPVAGQTPMQGGGNTWEAEFARVHGREADSYDAMVNQEMQKRMRPGQTPTREDWVRLTLDLNRLGKKGPGKPEFVTPAPTQAAPATWGTGTQQPTGQTWGNASQPQAAASTDFDPQKYAQYKATIEERANARQVDPALVAAVAAAESRFDPNARGKDGEWGMMQILPATAQGLGLTEDSWNHDRSNIDAGAKYLKQLMDRYQGAGNNQIPLALAAYNWGPGNVDNMLATKGTYPPEVLAHLQKYLGYYQTFKRAASEQ